MHTEEPDVPPGLLDIIDRHWGYRQLRPLQARAMQAALTGRDSLAVLPTGGGKSLCYQAPAVFQGGTTIVVSPLIALMKDQVDRLRNVGISAIRLDSSLTADERENAEQILASGQVRLLFVSPERLAVPGFAYSLCQHNIRSVAIDEAHCISQWGHDFRPDYRQLGRLRELFPGVSIHAYTATATPQVRSDIITQLGLVEPDVIVGTFDRPNLTYRILPRLETIRQVRQVIDRYPGSAGIIYCYRRKDVESLTDSLKAVGYSVVGYHAGMSAEDRQAAQDAFASGDVSVVVATVAFGMGIDRPDVRYVIHIFMPKSIENYQQETGRAGRDGQPSECVLFYSAADAISLKQMLERSAAESATEATYLPAALEHLGEMDRFCRGAVCRHKHLSRYFGQDLNCENCKACDLCLGDLKDVPDALITAQKILSCVARVDQSYGVGHVVSVLRGERSDSIQKRGHDRLSTFGLLRNVPEKSLRDWVYQLIGQEVLVQTGYDYPILRLNAASWKVMRGEQTVRLIQLAHPETKLSRRDKLTRGTYEVRPEDADLFEALREKRRELAAKEAVPPFLIFGDIVLRALAQIRPDTLEKMRQISGIGEVKLTQYGNDFLAVIQRFGPPVPASQSASLVEPQRPLSTRKQAAFDLFRQGASIEDVMQRMQVARSTAADYLTAYIEYDKPTDIFQWISEDVYNRVLIVVAQLGNERLKPIFEALQGRVPYDTIRLVLAHQKSLESKI